MLALVAPTLERISESLIMGNTLYREHPEECSVRILSFVLVFITAEIYFVGYQLATLKMLLKRNFNNLLFFSRFFVRILFEHMCLFIF